MSANTVRLALAPLKACLATAVEDGLIHSNPAAGVRIADTAAEPEAARPKALTEHELRALLAQLPDEWRLFFTLLAQTEPAHCGGGCAPVAGRGFRAAAAARAAALLPRLVRAA